MSVGGKKMGGAAVSTAPASRGTMEAPEAGEKMSVGEKMGALR